MTCSEVVPVASETRQSHLSAFESPLAIRVGRIQDRAVAAVENKEVALDVE